MSRRVPCEMPRGGEEVAFVSSARKAPVAQSSPPDRSAVMSPDDGPAEHHPAGWARGCSPAPASDVPSGMVNVPGRGVVARVGLRRHPRSGVRARFARRRGRAGEHVRSEGHGDRVRCALELAAGHAGVGDGDVVRTVGHRAQVDASDSWSRRPMRVRIRRVAAGRDGVDVDALLGAAPTTTTFTVILFSSMCAARGPVVPPSPPVPKLPVDPSGS